MYYIKIFIIRHYDSIWKIWKYSLYCIGIDQKVYLGFWNIQEVSKLRFRSVYCCKRTAVIIWVITRLSNECYWEAPRVSWATEHRGKSRYPNYCDTPLPSLRPMLDSYAPPAGRLYSLNYWTIVLNTIWSFTKSIGKLMILLNLNFKFRYKIIYFTWNIQSVRNFNHWRI